VANKALVVDGNSVVVKLVGSGEAWLGLTDSDDIAAFQREGLPIAAVNFAETLRIPNTVAIVTGGPHPDNAAKLVAFLNREDIKRRLADANAFAPVKPDDPLGLRVDWDALLHDQEKAVVELKEIFLR
jgi:iron(III) transport system substrate-binding protein